MKIIRKIVFYIWYVFIWVSIGTCGEALFTGEAAYTGPICKKYSDILKEFVVPICGIIFILHIWTERFPLIKKRFRKPSPYCKYCNERVGYFGKYRHHCDEEENYIDGVI